MLSWNSPTGALEFSGCDPVQPLKDAPGSIMGGPPRVAAMVAGRQESEIKQMKAKQRWFGMATEKIPSLVVAALAVHISALAGDGLGPGSVDLTFDPTRGGELIGLAGQWSGAPWEHPLNSVVVQPDGRFVIGGSFIGVNARLRNNFARLKADGSLDLSFGSSWGADGEVTWVARQADGKILLTGWFTSVQGERRDRIARLHSNGALDAEFAPSLQGGNPSPVIWHAVAQPDRKVLIAGSFNRVNDVSCHRVARLNADGSVDTSFNANVALAGEHTVAGYILLQPDGRLLLRGSDLGPQRQQLIRLNTDGSLDASFNVWCRGYSLYAVALQSDGKVLMAASRPFDVFRINPDGSRDLSFAPADLDTGSAYQIEAQPNGKILITGPFSAVNGVPRNHLARLNSDGSLDTGFDPAAVLTNAHAERIVPLSEGRALIVADRDFPVDRTQSFYLLQSDDTVEFLFDASFTSGSTDVDKILPLPDGQTLISGQFSSINGVPCQNAARLNSDGTLDTRYRPALSANGSFGFHMRQPDGKVLASGWLIHPEGEHREFAARLNPDGTLDPSFGGGLVEVRGINVMVAQVDGKTLIGGGFERVNGVERRYLARLNPDGSLDSSFAPPPLDIGDDHYITSLGVQSDGKIFAGGQIFDVPWETYYGVVRLHPDGSLDHSFHGRVRTDGTVFNIIIQPDDKILLDRGCTVDGTHRSGPVRLNADGSLDLSFRAAVPCAGEMGLTPDGKLLLDHGSSIVRLNPDGSLDESFQSEFGRDDSCCQIRAIAVRSDGNVLIGGGFTSVNDIPAQSLALLQGDLTHVPPSMPVSLEDQIRFAGRTATYTANAAGSLPMSYQWLFNGSPIPGATGATLVLSNAQPRQSGVYSVIVSNAADTVVSSPATLRVQPAPTGPGSVDVAFDLVSDGTRVGLEGNLGGAYSLALQPDGRVVVGGDFVGINRLPRNNLARLELDGAVDRSFRTTGTDRPVFATTTQPDGKVLIGGRFTLVNGAARPSLARLNIDGPLDMSFTPDLSRFTEAKVMAITVQPDGNILVGGDFVEMGLGGHVSRVLRFHPDGRLDNGFLAPVITHTANRFRSLALQPDGKILVGCAMMSPFQPLRRLNTDGTLDETFAPPIHRWSRDPEVTAIAVQGDGRILIGGDLVITNSTGHWRAQLARLEADGELDLSFEAGVQVDTVCSIQIQPDGKLLLGGSSWTQELGVAHLVRLNPDGSRDPSYHPYQPPTHTAGSVRALALRPDGSVVACRDYDPGFAWDSGYIFQCTPTGQADSGWSQTAQKAGTILHTIVPQSDGKVLIGGHFQGVNGVRRSGLARLDANGTLDGEFKFGPFASDSTEVDAIAVQADHRILVAGPFRFYDEQQWRSNLVRLHPEGNTDTSFSTPALDGNVLSLAVQPDGKILAGGWFTTPSPYLTRFLPNGSVDSEFVSAIEGDDDIRVAAITVLPDTRMLVGGEFHSYGGVRRVGLARLHEDGTLDETFVPDPSLRFDVGVLAIQPNGQLLVGGHMTGQDDSSHHVCVVRLNSDGSWDSSFKTDWLGDGAVSSLALQDDGKVIVGGYFRYAPEEVKNRRVLRLNSDGSLDPSFEPEGASPPLAILPDGKVLVAVPQNFINGILCGGIARLNSDLVMPFVERELPPAYLPGSVFRVHLLADPLWDASVYAVEDRVPPGWSVTDISHDGAFDTHTGKVKFGPFGDPVPRALTYDVQSPMDANDLQCFTGTASADGASYPITGDDCIGPARRLHPADRNPADSLMTIGEVTGYGRAWREGESWPLSPNPIPIDYVTRAVTLWKGGELYVLDLAMGEPPMCWVNLPPLDTPPPADSPLGRHSDEDTRVIQQAPRVYVPGEPMMLAIEVTPGRGAAGYAVEMECQLDGHVSEISDGGRWDNGAGKLKWGPFLDDTPRGLQFQVVPALWACEALDFSGVVSVDGRSTRAEGRSVVQPGCRLTGIASVDGGRVLIDLRGGPGLRYDIEVSSDLETWTLLGEARESAGQVEIVDPENERLQQRFYRLRQIPTSSAATFGSDE